MWRTGVGAIGVLLVCAFLSARPTSARQPCRVSVENLALTLQEVRIDGAIAIQVAVDRYATDAGSLDVSSEAVVRLEGDSLTLPLCQLHESQSLTTWMTDPLSGEGGYLTFEAMP